jgi:hypothetical protein
MATNIGYISSANGTNFLTVTNGEFLRRVDSSWNKLRIGLRLSFKEFTSGEGGPTTPGNLFGSPRLYVGMCNYDKGGIGSKNSAMHFVGTRTASVTWARTANGGAAANVPYFTSTMQTIRREVNTITAGTASGASLSLPIYGTSNYFMFSVDIDRANPSTTVLSTFGPSNSATGIYNVTQAQFLTAMETAVPVLTGYTYSSLAPVVVNEGINGVLDAINIYWSRSRCVVNITDVWYSVLA